MDDLIKRQDAIGKIQTWLKLNGYSYGERNVMGCTIQMLEDLPSAEPVIRCKDCEHDDYCCRLSSRTPNDYCSHAKRRTDG